MSDGNIYKQMRIKAEMSRREWGAALTASARAVRMWENNESIPRPVFMKQMRILSGVKD